VYFAYQGLFMAVLLALFLYQGREREAWALRAGLLCAATLLSLAAIRLAPEPRLSRWWFHAGLFVGDALTATVVLAWTRPRSETYLVYFLVVFGSALTRSARQSAVVAVAVLSLYGVLGLREGAHLVHSEFWLRGAFLAVSAALMAILAGDAQRAQAEEKRRYDERLIQVERLATLGQAAAEVAHRIKAPLTTIAVNAEVLAARAKDPAVAASLAEIGEEVGRIKSILKNLLDLGRIEEMDDEPLDLRGPLEDALRGAKAAAEERGVAVEASGLEAPLPARGDGPLLREAALALLLNAVEASPRGGRVRVAARAAGGFLRVEIADDGPGVAAEDLERVFQPFYTTKPEGSGLGLSAALRIAQKHGGSVELEGPGPGARFALTIPSAG
jgi:signal transduction histidine kinase